MRKILISALTLLLLSVTIPALAHEGREVGDYAVQFGWRVEPAYAGVYNGPEFWVTEHDTDTPVEGLEDTLTLTVAFGDQSKTLLVYAVWNDPGHYTADLLPTRPGDYRFQLTGTINGQPIDETFSSADGGFSSIEPMSDIAFPASETGDLAALQAQIDDLRAQIAQLTAAETN